MLLPRREDFHKVEDTAMSRLLLLAATAIVTLAAGQAEAHAPGSAAGGLPAGFTHPFLGVDHLLAMVAVGLMAVQQQSQNQARALWALPLTFVLGMAGGTVLGLWGVGGEPLELGITGSVVLLGGLVAWGRALPLGAAVGVVAVLSAFHGHAHGLEMPAEASAALYAAGVLAGTAILHGAGVLAAKGLKARAWAVRAVGSAFAAAGVVLMVG